MKYNTQAIISVVDICNNDWHFLLDFAGFWSLQLSFIPLALLGVCHLCLLSSFCCNMYDSKVCKLTQQTMPVVNIEMYVYI